MQKIFSTYHSYLSKVLLGLVCLWSVFLFSGYVETDVLTLPETETTELVETKAKKNLVVFFQKAQAFRDAFSTQIHSFYRTEFALNNYNNLIEVALLQLQKEGFNYLIWRPFLFNKTFPVSTKLDTPSFLIS